MTMKTKGLLACRECDGLQREIDLPDGGAAHCQRCGALLYRRKVHSLDHTLAWLVASAFLFAFANVFPLLELDAQGVRTSTTIAGTALELHRAGMTSVAALVFATAVLLPAVQMAVLLYMLVPLRLGFVPRRFPEALSAANLVGPWVMVDVFLLGALVSLVKLTQLADVDPQVGLYACGAYILTLAAAVAAFEPRELWACVDELGPGLLRSGGPVAP